MRPLARLLLLAALLAGCDAGPLGAPGPGETGLRGRVVRGPTQPVCREGEPCSEPFSAGFTVRRGTRAVGTFETGADGRFAIRLAPGTYGIVPDADAPLLQPEQQRQDVTVGPDGATEVEVEFDTGIR
jgi:hypothetical protein